MLQALFHRLNAKEFGGILPFWALLKLVFGAQNSYSSSAYDAVAKYPHITSFDGEWMVILTTQAFHMRLL